jgi:hypothetical protein
MKEFSIIELLMLRNWASEVYHSGKCFTTVSSEQLQQLLKKLCEIDEEILFRIFSNKSVTFSDQNFLKTLSENFPDKVFEEIK